MIIIALCLQQEIDSRGLTSDVVYYGPIYGNAKEQFWKQADIFVLPTFRECFPLVVCEAMQHQLPCVATNDGGYFRYHFGWLDGNDIRKG